MLRTAPDTLSRALGLACKGLAPPPNLCRLHASAGRPHCVTGAPHIHNDHGTCGPTSPGGSQPTSHDWACSAEEPVGIVTQRHLLCAPIEETTSAAAEPLMHEQLPAAARVWSPIHTGPDFLVITLTSQACEGGHRQIGQCRGASHWWTHALNWHKASAPSGRGATSAWTRYGAPACSGARPQCIHSAAQVHLSRACRPRARAREWQMPSLTCCRRTLNGLVLVRRVEAVEQRRRDRIMS